MKFLTYTPWRGQLNNTRMCFETALILAVISSRTLVLPRGYRLLGEPEGDGNAWKPLYPGEFLDFDKIRAVVRMISFEEYRRDHRVGIADVADLLFETGTAVFCFPAIPPPGSSEATTLKCFAAGRPHWLELTPRMRKCRTLNLKSANLEHFYSFFYFLKKGDETNCKRFIRDYVKFKPEIIGVATAIATRLRHYGAIHIRRNDFFHQYPEQNISAAQILQNIRPHIAPHSKLYISTDERDRNFLAVFRGQYEVCLLDDFRSMIPAHMPLESRACVEQLICSFSTVFVGTRLSTFSGYITRLRGYRGQADKQILFTDGFSTSELDRQGHLPFSWINWMQSGNPWWGREYKEAWEF